MLNEIREMRKNREKESLSTGSTIQDNNTKSGILNKLDQEIIQNYKLKVNKLEGDNLKLKEDYFAVQRNFEAICLKNKGDGELIKKLEEELNYHKQRFSSYEKDNSKYETEKNEIITTYREKIDHLNGVIRNLEGKINNQSTNGIKFLEKETFYKSFIAKLEEKNKNISKASENSEQEFKKLKEEINKLKDDNFEIQKNLEEKNNSLQSLENKNKSLNNLPEVNDKMKKENDLIMKLLEETRGKLTDSKSLNTEKDNYINSLKDQLNSINSKIDLLENQNQNLINEILLKEKKMTEINLKIEILEPENKELIEKLRLKENQWLEVTKRNDELLTSNANFLMENSKLSSELDQNIRELNNFKKNDNKNKLDELTAQNHKLVTNNSILNSEIDLVKKENKNLKLEIESKGNYEEMEKMNEEKTRILLFKVLKENILNIENTNKKIMDNNFQPIQNKVILLENKFRNLSEVLLEKISNLKTKNKNSSDLSSNEIKQREKDFSETISKLRLENKELITKNNDLRNKNDELDNFNKRFKTELDTYKLLLSEESNKQISIREKIENKRKKLRLLREEKDKFEFEINNLKNQIKDLEIKLENSKNSSELKSCIQQIMSSNFKLALSLDSLYYMSLCRGCSEEKSPQFIRSCGHSTCEECLTNKKECTECKEFNSLKIIIQNSAYTNIISKILFINQVKNDINSIIDFIKMKLS